MEESDEAAQSPINGRNIGVRKAIGRARRQEVITSKDWRTLLLDLQSSPGSFDSTKYEL